MLNSLLFMLLLDIPKNLYKGTQPCCNIIGSLFILSVHQLT